MLCPILISVAVMPGAFSALATVAVRARSAAAAMKDTGAGINGLSWLVRHPMRRMRAHWRMTKGCAFSHPPIREGLIASGTGRLASHAPHAYGGAGLTVTHPRATGEQTWNGPRWSAGWFLRAVRLGRTFGVSDVSVLKEP